MERTVQERKVGLEDGQVASDGGSRAAASADDAGAERLATQECLVTWLARGAVQRAQQEVQELCRLPAT